MVAGGNQVRIRRAINEKLKSTSTTLEEKKTEAKENK
jgi:hypothetical protein